jgi:predicted secreted protein
VSITQAPGSTLSLGKGQYASLRLQEDPAGGYAWEFTTSPDAGILKVVSDQPQAGPPYPTHKWVFQAVGAGTTTFKVIERKPTDAVNQAIHEYDLTVTVAP